MAPIAGYDHRESDECPPYDVPIPALPTFEDHDLGLRAGQLGHRMLAVPQGLCHHGRGDRKSVV